MSDLTDALAIAIEALEEHTAEDAALAAWLDATRAQLEALALYLEGGSMAGALRVVPQPGG